MDHCFIKKSAPAQKLYTVLILVPSYFVHGHRALFLANYIFLAQKQLKKLASAMQPILPSASLLSKTESAESEVDDQTSIGGTAWQILKQSAMKDDYKQQVWYGELDDQAKQLLE